MSRPVIYTAVFGGYDVVRAPIHADTLVRHAELVCFTDGADAPAPWVTRRVSLPVAGDPARSNRRLKILAHELFPDREFSIYVDGNIRLVLEDPRHLLERWLADADIACFLHAHMQCSYEEARWMLRSGVEQGDVVRAQIARYRAAGFPEQYGKINGNILLRRHNAPELVRFAEQWWDEVEKGSRRDQMPFDYLRWKTGLKVNFIPGPWTNNSIGFREEHALGRAGTAAGPGARQATERAPLARRIRNAAAPALHALTSALHERDERRRHPGTLSVGNARIRLADASRAEHERARALRDAVARTYFPLPAGAPRIVDIGAGVGVATAVLAARLPNARIMAYEPEAARFAALADNLALLQRTLGLEQAEAHAHAVGARAGSVPFHRSHASTRPVLPADPADFIADVVGVTEVCAEPTDLLRLNTPGLELGMLERLETAKLLDAQRSILIEYHLFADRPNELPALLALLERSGFRTYVEGALPYPSAGRRIRERVEAVTRVLAVRTAA